ncbi:MAG: hypothetical protein ABR985_16025 [Methanotrichaceae archaeon]|jgi:hypothetical protein
MSSTIVGNAKGGDAYLLCVVQNYKIESYEKDLYWGLLLMLIVVILSLALINS